MKRAFKMTEKAFFIALIKNKTKNNFWKVRIKL